MTTLNEKTGTVEVQRVSKSFSGLSVLKDVVLRFNPGETSCIIGPSGSGKSTLLRCINNLESPDEGYVAVDGEVIGFEERRGRLQTAKPKTIEHQRQRIGMVFQGFNLFPHMTALDNVMVGPRVLKKHTKSQAREEALRQLDRVGMIARKDAFAGQLSGGQQQRVAIARALAMRPSVMLFDEPTSALDPELVDDVLGVMRSIAEEGMTMIVVTHELMFANDVAHHVVFMDAGQVVEEGTAAEVLHRPTKERTQAFVARVHRRAAE